MPPRYRPNIPQETVQEALDALRARESRVAIAERLGVSPAWVSKLAAAHGIVSVHRTVRNQIMQGTYRLGARTMPAFFLSLPEEVIEWIHKSRPDGMTFTDNVRKILIDAYQKRPR